MVIDSRGNPTVEAMSFSMAERCRAAVLLALPLVNMKPSNSRDGDKSKYLGKGVLKGVANANNEIAKSIAGLDAADQRALDHKMISLDGTPTKSRLGANAILAAPWLLRALLRRAQAAALQISFALFHRLVRKSAPCPMMNILNGGAHATVPWTFRKFMVMPVGATNFFGSVALARGFPRPQDRAEEARLLHRRRR